MLRIHIHQTMEFLEPQWRELEQNDDVSVHQSYDWCRTWVETHNCTLLIIEGRSAERSEFLVPLEIVLYGAFRVGRFIAGPFSNINTGLFRNHDPLNSGRRLETIFCEARSRLADYFDLMLLESVPIEWRGNRSPFHAFSKSLNQNPSFQLTLKADFETTLLQLNAKRRRKKYQSSEKNLKAIGQYSHSIASDPDEIATLVNLFFDQKSARFKAHGLPDVFRSGETRHFFQKLAQLRSNGPNSLLELHSLQLTERGQTRVLAILGVSRKGGHIVCQFGSIDDTYAAHVSPGEVLYYIVIRTMCEQDMLLFDFGIGDQQYKRSWCNIQTQQYDVYFATTLKGRVMKEIHKATLRAKLFIKSNPRLYRRIQNTRAALSSK
ncbi:MAG: GNAT family N-acetyltransferase [Allorhizobium sp.]